MNFHDVVSDTEAVTERINSPLVPWFWSGDMVLVLRHWVTASISLPLVLVVGCGYGASRVRPGDAHSTTPMGCSLYCPPQGPSNLRVIGIGGPALASGYLDPTAGLRIRLLSAKASRVTEGGACFEPAPQYQLYIHVAMSNTTTHQVLFDWVGLTVRGLRGRILTPFHWATFPSHAIALPSSHSRVAWLPYDGWAPHRFTVQWVNTYGMPIVVRDKGVLHPQHWERHTIASYRAHTTTVKICR
jgi:hypothetical protein